jgi:hypothetical protein
MTEASRREGGRVNGRRIVYIAVLVGMLAVACARMTDRGPEESTANPPSRRETILLQGGPATPPIPFITDDAVVGLRQGDLPLTGAASPTLIDGAAPLGIPSPDGRLIAYNAWTDLVPFDPDKSWSQLGVEPGDRVGTPSIRVLNLGTGEDSLLVDGAYSLAWRADGTIAYVEGVERDYRADVPYLGNVVVRPSLNAPAQTWSSTPDRYVVYGWAGSRLIVFRGSELATDVLFLSGPGEARKAPIATFVAISPDGELAATFGGSSLESDPGGQGMRFDIVNLDSGQVTGSIGPDALSDPLSGLTIRSLSGGSWAGPWVVAKADVVSSGGPGVGIAVFRVEDGIPTLDRILLLPSARFPMGIEEPLVFDRPDGPQVIAWAPMPGAGGEARGIVYTYLHCEVAADQCTTGPLVQDRVFRPVNNPSRPIPVVVPGA